MKTRFSYHLLVLVPSFPPYTHLFWDEPLLAAGTRPNNPSDYSDEPFANGNSMVKAEPRPRPSLFA
jgi:hypothetical protein